LKFFLGLILSMIAIYFGLDSFLKSRFLPLSTTPPEQEKVIVQNMARFLETNPDLQKSIEQSGERASAQSPASTTAPPDQGSANPDLAKLARYFGNTPTDEYFKKFLLERKSKNESDPDRQVNLFIDMSEYLVKHPLESIHSLENALQAIPREMTAEREAILPAFIHSAIYYIENQVQDDESRRTYLNRFLSNAHEPLVKNALETHFSDLIESGKADQNRER
jgi:hypothetical protein